MKTLWQNLIVLLSNGFLVFLASELNSALASLSLYLTVGGILVVFPALKLPFYSGFPAVLLTGAFLDSMTPAAPGLFLFLILFLYAGLFHLRVRLRVQTGLQFAIVASLANLILLILVTLWFLPDSNRWAYGSRFAGEMFLSEAVVFAAAFWFYDLQETCLDLLGARPTAEETA